MQVPPTAESTRSKQTVAGLILQSRQNNNLPESRIQARMRMIEEKVSNEVE